MADVSDAKQREPQGDGREIRVGVAEEGACLRRVDVEVDAARVRRAYDAAYRQLAKQARVRGFRPGKAPRSVLEKLFGASVDEQLEQSLVAETLPEAIEIAGLEPASEPAVDAQPPSPDRDFHYAARVEVRPELELPELDGLAARRLAVEVEDEDVERELEALRQRSAPLVEEPEGTPLEAGHFATLDFVGRIDGEPFPGSNGQGVSVEIGSGRLLPGFEEQLVGAVAGEDREVTARFPEEHANEKLAGREARFAVHVVDVKRRELPALDDEFAKDLGEFDSLAELRERIRSDLLAARERESQAQLRASLMDSLIERASFDVPPGMVQRELERELAAARRRLEGAVPEASMEAQLSHWREEWRGRAEREVRERLLLDAVARAEQVEVSDDEVSARLDAMAAEQGVAAARLKKAYGDGLTDALRAQLREEKALAVLASRAKVGETTGS